MRRNTALLTIILLTATAAFSAVAAPPYPAERGDFRTDRESLDDTVAEMRQRGRVLSAEEQQRDGRPVHAIRLLTPEGRVKRIYVDPQRRRSAPGR